MTAAFALFGTPIGVCAIAFGEQGLIGVQLPAKDDAMLRQRMQRMFPRILEAAANDEALAAIDGMRRLLTGERLTLHDLRLDMRAVPAFAARVYAITRAIPPGETLTYGEVARRLGEPGAALVPQAAQAVGKALGQNPLTIVVPCHRVTGAGDWQGGFSAWGGGATKMRLLRIEGAAAAAQLSLFD